MFSKALATFSYGTVSYSTRCRDPIICCHQAANSQHCRRPWAIRQLTVEDAMRRGICQDRRGFSYARSASMMDNTLTIVSLEMVKKLNRRSLRGIRKVGTPQCTRKESGCLRSRPQCPLVRHMPTLLLGNLSDDPHTILHVSCSLRLGLEARHPYPACDCSRPIPNRSHYWVSPGHFPRSAIPPVSSIAEFSVSATVSSPSQRDSRSYPLSS